MLLLYHYLNHILNEELWNDSISIPTPRPLGRTTAQLQNFSIKL